MSRTALDGFPLGDIEIPVNALSLLLKNRFTGVKRFYAGSDPALRCFVFA
jgi:hypothetical protein